MLLKIAHLGGGGSISPDTRWSAFTPVGIAEKEVSSFTLIPCYSEFRRPGSSGMMMYGKL